MPPPIRRTQQQRRASTERRVVEAAIELIAQRGSRSAGGLAELLAFVEQYLRLLREAAPTGQAFLLLWAEAVAGESSLKPLFVERDRSFRKVIAGHVRQGIEEGSIRPDADPDGTASLILAILRGVGLHLMLDPRAVSHRTVTATAVDTIRHALSPTCLRPTDVA
jgi:AcrR family transcriptional regulator